MYMYILLAAIIYTHVRISLTVYQCLHVVHIIIVTNVLVPLHQLVCWLKYTAQSPPTPCTGQLPQIPDSLPAHREIQTQYSTRCRKTCCTQGLSCKYELGSCTRTHVHAVKHNSTDKHTVRQTRTHARTHARTHTHTCTCTMYQQREKTN